MKAEIVMQRVQERLFTGCLEHQPPWWCKKYCSSHLQSLLQNLLSEIVKIYIMLFMGLFSEWTQKKQEARIHVLAFHSFDLKTIVFADLNKVLILSQLLLLAQQLHLILLSQSARRKCFSLRFAILPSPGVHIQDHIA